MIKIDRRGLCRLIAALAMTFAVLLNTATQMDAVVPSAASPRVTCDLQGTDLGTLAKYLTAKTRVRFRVGSDIAGEKLDVFVKDYPLDALQRNIARVFGYRWYTKKTEDGAVIRVLYRDPRVRREQDRLRALLVKAEVARKNAGFGRIREVLALSDADADKLAPEEAGFRNYMSWEPRKPLYDAFAGLSDVQIGQLAVGRSVIVDLSGKSSEERANLLGSLLRNNEDASQFADAAAIEFVGDHRWATGRRWSGDAFFLKITGANGSRLTDVCYLTPDAMANRPAKLDKSVLADTLKTFKPSPEVSGKRADRLEKIVKFDAKTVIGFHTGMRAVARATGVPIVSDYYTGGHGAVPARDQKARNLIAYLPGRYGHSWAWDGEALVFRTDTWPVMMIREVPNRTLAALKSAGANGELNFDQSLIASRLSVEQITNLPNHGYYAAWIADEKLTSVVRFIGGLPGAAVKQLGAEAGLLAGLVPRTARIAYYEMLGVCFPGGITPASIEAVRASVTPIPAAPGGVASSRFAFEFLFGIGGGQRREVLDWYMGPTIAPNEDAVGVPAN